ncbi:hypothetical protein QQF64_013336 [Cirrhinus molitorella]|uniref:Uncharacterized protein n=1 Tax=Cirrhinus molitorella TaxID=172907 RepID=A0ABR3LQV7_9TELE
MVPMCVAGRLCSLFTVFFVVCLSTFLTQSASDSKRPSGLLEAFVVLGKCSSSQDFQTVDALREAIFTTWSNVPTSLLETVASSMLKQIFEVINKNG